MGGYQRTPKVYKLVFTDPEYDGLIVRVRSIKIGELRELLGLASAVAGGQVDLADASKVDRLFGVFADALLDWNLEDDQGRPVPANLEGVSTQDADFISEIVREWMKVFQVAGPLGNGSSDGAKSLEASLPMEARSPSRQN
jgi:hypothetical protein